MKIRILCLDDNLQTLSQPLHAIFGTLCVKGAIPELFGGLSAPFEISGFGETALSIEIVSNTQNDPIKVCNEIDSLSQTNKFDIVFVDDDWGRFGNTEGQFRLLPKVISSITGISPELPALVLFTQHWEQTDRVRAFCELMNRFQGEQRRLTGLHKNDTSGLMLLTQRVVSEKKVVEDRARLAEENRLLQKQLEKTCPRPNNMIGGSAAMREVYQNIKLTAPTRATVLILGETGTGKEEVAKAIHRSAGKETKQFHSVNCGAITDSLSESELFGHEKGAFTGAVTQKKGWFETAADGTIFLDEIGDLTQSIQVKLLRVLQNGEFSRVGGTSVLQTKARIIAATNKDLKAEVEQGRFREELYYRINVFPIVVPPLRDRQEDIPSLVDYFVKGACDEYYKQCEKVSAPAMALLVGYSWPGNVRELENYIIRSVIRCQGQEILPDDIPAEVRSLSVKEGGQDWCPPGLNRGNAGTAEGYLNICEKIAIRQGKVTQPDLAREWGVSRPAVTQRINKLGKELRALLEWPPNASRWSNARRFVMGWDAVRLAEHPE